MFLPMPTMLEPTLRPVGSRRFLLASLALVAGLLMTGCTPQSSTQINYRMGDRITVGPISYNIIQTEWKGELGNGVMGLRYPQSRFLIMTISVTNGGGSEISIPLLTLEGNNKEYQESSDGQGVDQWMGLLRTLAPAETRQGKVVFDVPLTSYRLRLTDGGGAGTEKTVWVDIPLRMDMNQGIEVPLTPGAATQ
jgi:hypothetical protein